MSNRGLQVLENVDKAVVTLNISDNVLTGLPPLVGQLSSMKSLDANSNQLTTLPAEIGELAGLEELLLYKNELKELPKELGGCTALQTLNVFNNKLRKLPDALGDLTNLDEVNAACNKLMMVGEKVFTNWQKVTVLNLYNNNLVRFASLLPLVELKELRLYENNLEELPALPPASKIEIFEMHKNRVATTPADYFAATPALKKLTLHSNGLTNLDGSICSCSELEILQVQSNKLGTLPALAWPSPLETLFIQENGISELPDELCALSNLKRCDISQLKLSAAAVAVAEQLKKACLSKADGIFWGVDGVKIQP